MDTADEGTTPAASGVTARIEGSVSGQVAVGSYIVQIGSVSGGVVHVAPPGAQPTARVVPVFLRPRPFAHLLGRGAEVGEAVSALQSALTVEVCGAPGLGKTTLLRHLAYEAGTSGFRDGVVYLSARDQPAEDLLQFLFGAFFECSVSFKPTTGQLRHGLQNKQALLLIDDAELPGESVETLLQAVPAATFLFARTERGLWGEARPIALTGLPLSDALLLFERELGRTLVLEERPNAEALCRSLDGHPLHVLQAAASVRERRRTLADLAGNARADSVSGPERTILSVLALLGGLPVHAEPLSAIAGIADVERLLDDLAQRRLVEAQGAHRYRLVDGAQIEGLEPSEHLARALVVFADRARRTPEQRLAEADVLAHLVRLGARAGRWAETADLAQSLEGALALGGRWGAWERTLQTLGEAAGVLGNTATAAYALHQRGTRALLLEDGETALGLLTEALALRVRLGDTAGAAATRQNLRLLAPVAPPEPDPPTQHTPTPRETLPAAPPPVPETPGFDPVRRWTLAGAALFAIVALVCGLLWLRPNAVTLAALTVEPVRIAGGQTARGTVRLARPAPAGGATITLRSLREDVATVQPETVTIPSGRQSADFRVSARLVTADTEAPLRAMLGDSSVERTLTVLAAPTALARVEIRPDRVVAGTSVRGTVFLTGPAPVGGAVVALAAKNGIGLAAAVTVGANKQSAAFSIRTTDGTGDVSVTATYGGVSKTAALHLLSLESLTLDPSQVVAGQPAKATVTLSGEAPENGVAVTLESGDTNRASVPASVLIPAGQRSATIDISTTANGADVAEVTLAATVGNVRREARLSLQPANPTEPLRVGRVRLLQPAPEDDGESKTVIEFGASPPGEPPTLETGASFAVEIEFTGGPLNPDSVVEETFFVEQDTLAIAAGVRTRGRIVRLPDGKTVRWVSGRRVLAGRYHVSLKGSGTPGVTAQNGEPLEGGDFQFDLDVRQTIQ